MSTTTTTPRMTKAATELRKGDRFRLYGGTATMARDAPARRGRPPVTPEKFTALHVRWEDGETEVVTLPLDRRVVLTD